MDVWFKPGVPSACISWWMLKTPTVSFANSIFPLYREQCSGTATLLVMIQTCNHLLNMEEELIKWTCNVHKSLNEVCITQAQSQEYSDLPYFDNDRPLCSCICIEEQQQHDACAEKNQPSNFDPDSAEQALCRWYEGQKTYCSAFLKYGTIDSSTYNG